MYIDLNTKLLILTDEERRKFYRTRRTSRLDDDHLILGIIENTI